MTSSDITFPSFRLCLSCLAAGICEYETGLCHTFTSIMSCILSFANFIPERINMNYDNVIQSRASE